MPPPKCVHCTDINSTEENVVGFNKLYITLEKRIKIFLSHSPMQYIYANNLIHVGLIEQTVKLIILFLGHLHSGDTKLGPGKCAHNLCIYYLTLSNPGYHYQTQGTYQIGMSTSRPCFTKRDIFLFRVSSECGWRGTDLQTSCIDKLRSI